VKTILKQQSIWRCLPLIGLTILLTGCVTAAHPPCSTPQRLARLRQEQLLRNSIAKRRRALVATQTRVAGLNCRNQSPAHHTTVSCQTLLRHSQSLVAQIQHEEAQLQHLLKASQSEQSGLGLQTSCAATPQPKSTHSALRHHSKHLHHHTHPSPRSPSHHKAHAPVEVERRHAEPPVALAPAISEAARTASAPNKENASIPAQPSAPAVAPQPAEHDYVVDPHMRVIGRSFFQDDIKLHHEPAVQ